MPEKPQGDSAPESGAVDAPVSQWTEEDQREAEAFAKGFIALMTYARTQGIFMAFGPVCNMEPGASTTPDQHEEAPTGSKDKPE